MYWFWYQKFHMGINECRTDIGVFSLVFFSSYYYYMRIDVLECVVLDLSNKFSNTLINNFIRSLCFVIHLSVCTHRYTSIIQYVSCFFLWVRANDFLFISSHGNRKCFQDYSSYLEFMFGHIPHNHLRLWWFNISKMSGNSYIAGEHAGWK